MEKLTLPYDKEYMRMAMLKHEETFREQVYELHRLYRIQKILMQNIENSRGIEQSQQEWHFKNEINLTQTAYLKGAQKRPKMKFDLERPAKEHIAESNGDGILEIIDETEIELTLGPQSYNRRKKVETRLTSDSGNSLSSSTGSSQMNKTSCRTHHSSDSTREELSGGTVGRVQTTDSMSGYQRGIRNIFDVEDQSRQEKLKQPPWLFQVLGLNIS